ncbi:hypothetical protein HPB47_021963 [Ixodes persulcatus]|uniref:Uncharacterized protein n=1 Tax=Ixodes persulcatus TaxID=34615 RepID=A0AC60QC27_IXOPE|nr:hypothetical protein HPB47_021963 [Ixodes persulcatus]
MGSCQPLIASGSETWTTQNQWVVKKEGEKGCGEKIEAGKKKRCAVTEPNKLARQRAVAAAQVKGTPPTAEMSSPRSAPPRRGCEGALPVDVVGREDTSTTRRDRYDGKGRGPCTRPARSPS